MHGPRKAPHHLRGRGRVPRLTAHKPWSCRLPPAQNQPAHESTHTHRTHTRTRTHTHTESVVACPEHPGRMRMLARTCTLRLRNGDTDTVAASAKEVVAFTSLLTNTWQRSPGAQRSHKAPTVPATEAGEPPVLCTRGSARWAAEVQPTPRPESALKYCSPAIGQNGILSPELHLSRYTQNAEVAASHT
jgi:hypothetical protein